MVWIISLGGIPNVVLLGQRTWIHLRPSIHKVKEKAGGQKWLVAWRGDSGTGQVENGPWLRTKTACRGGLGGACGAQRLPVGRPAQCSLGAFPTWARSCHHGTWVTEKSQGLGFLKHETSQTRWCSFLLGSRRTPQEGPTPDQEAEMGHSSSAAPELTWDFQLLGLFFLPYWKKFKTQLTGESQALFSFPCLEGKRTVAPLLRPGHVPGAVLAARDTVVIAQSL